MQVVVIGMGRYGNSLAIQLSTAGVKVVAVDLNAERVDAIRDHVAVAVRLDSTDESELREQRIERVDVAVVAIGAHFESSALTTALLKKLGVKRVIARATSMLRGRILRLVGADEIVSPEEEAARHTAHRILRPALADYLKLTAARSVVEVIAPSTFDGKTLLDLDLRRRYNVQILGIKRKVLADDGEEAREQVIDTPDAREPLQAGDGLIGIGRDEDLARFVKSIEAER